MRRKKNKKKNFLMAIYLPPVKEDDGLKLKPEVLAVGPKSENKIK